MRALVGFDRQGDVLQHVLHREAEGAARQRLDQVGQGLAVGLLGGLGVAAEVLADLERIRAAPEAHFQAATAHLVEHADLLGDSYRRVERQRVDHRPEAQVAGALRDRGQEHRRRGRHARGREMVLGAVVGGKAGAVIGLDHAQALFIEIGERQVALVDVIEHAERDGFHAGWYSVSPLVLRSLWLRGEFRGPPSKVQTAGAAGPGQPGWCEGLRPGTRADA